MEEREEYKNTIQKKEKKGREIRVSKVNDEGKHPNISRVIHSSVMFDCYTVSPQTMFR